MRRIFPLLLLLACAGTGPKVADFQAKINAAQAMAAEAEQMRKTAETSVYTVGRVVSMMEQTAEEKARELLASNARVKRAEKQVQALRKMKQKVKRVAIDRVETVYKLPVGAMTADKVAKLKQGIKEARATNTRAAASAAVLRGVIDDLQIEEARLQQEIAMRKSLKGRAPMVGVGFVALLVVAILGRILFMVAQEA